SNNHVCPLILLFCIFHHAHVLEKQTCHSMLSKFALAFGVVSAFGSFAAGNCNAGTLTLLHFLGAGVSFVCVSFYAVLLTELTRKCDLTGHEKVLYPLRFISTVIQIFATIFCILSEKLMPSRSGLESLGVLQGFRFTFEPIAGTFSAIVSNVMHMVKPGLCF
uniref:CWH43-like N-terminal domain-containing protein n=1 Tax=Nothobranchius furzeri TaxID=105023 RepID=A0A8C6KQD7_NOTFU